MKITLRIMMAYLVSFVFSTATLSGQKKSEKKAIKNAQEQEEFLKTKTLVEGAVYTFNAEWATTQKGRRINLMGNPNFLRLDHQNIDVDLPYFGVAQVAYGYGSSSSGGVVAKGEIYKESQKVDERKRRITTSFSVKNNSENFRMILTIYGNGNANLSVSSSNRNRITYDGKIEASAVPVGE
ncbi:DUF4251 domain-containing protein [Mangrovimonas sp. TPBH4]|uniref:DUF4251 domain-containing protein n=1 Tax=Mangrovimonas sp. TPBH4 TaxID=1645914 RepID=UPI0009E8A48A|nr:DUF4251 domain-containing protein [Mangrovimonas sp. TPBH4]